MGHTKGKLHPRRPSKCFFAIIFEGRTGSSYVASCLNSHPDVLCYPEILDHRNARSQMAILELLFDGRPVETLNPYAKDRRYTHGSIQQKGHLQAVGFKTQLQRVLHLQHFFGRLRGNGCKLLYLKRRNVIKSVLSVCNAQRLHRRYRLWNAEYRDQVQGALYIEPERFAEELYRRLQIERGHELFFEAYDLEKRIFYYEDLLGDQEAFFHHLLAYMGVDFRDMKGTFLKNTPDRLSEAIINYEEIRSLFAGTHFEQFFEE